jgi:ribosome biogenesis protein BRX1
MMAAHSLLADVKLDRKDGLATINEVCELKSCNSCIFFECRKHRDTYMWLSNTPNGPSAKFLVENSCARFRRATKRVTHSPSRA